MNTNENPYGPANMSMKPFAGSRTKGFRDIQTPPGRVSPGGSKILGVPSDWILCGNGSDDILTILTRAFVPEGGLLRLAYPSYILYRSLAQIQGAASEEVLFGADWSLPDYFGAAPSIGSTHHLRQIPNTKLGLVYLPVPNSPSGTIIPKERILAFAESLPCPLLIDEAYVDFAQENCIDLVRTSPKIMVSRTLSKAYSLAGLRFGFLIARPETILELIKVKDVNAPISCHDHSDHRRSAVAGQKSSKILATRKTLIIRMANSASRCPIPRVHLERSSDQSVSHKAIYNIKAQLLVQHGLSRLGEDRRARRRLRIAVGTDTQPRMSRSVGSFYRPLEGRSSLWHAKHLSRNTKETKIDLPRPRRPEPLGLNRARFFRPHDDPFRGPRND